jgi:type I restriction enzyme, S subunit
MRGPLSAHLIEQLRPLNMADDEVYNLVTVKRSRGGVVLRERLKGSQIAVKSQFRLKAGDFLISKRQIVHGACGIVPPELDGAIVSNEYSVLRARSTLDLDFLNCLAHSIYFQQTCFHSSIGVHVEKMIFKLDEWMKWDFDLPPIREQGRIAEILSTWDRAIETVEPLIVNARAQKAALMRLLLSGKRRLPGFSGAWREATIAAVGRVVTGNTPPTNDRTYYGGGIPFVAPGDLGRGKYVSSSEKTISEHGLTVCRPLPVGATLFTCIGSTIGKMGLAACRLATNQQINAVVPNADNDPEFVYYQLTHVADRVAQMAGAHAVPMISKSQFSGERIVLPALPEQRRIAEILSIWDGVIESTEAQLTALRREKAALMQQLLTGKRRVKVAESEAA